MINDNADGLIYIITLLLLLVVIVVVVVLFCVRNRRIHVGGNIFSGMPSVWSTVIRPLTRGYMHLSVRESVSPLDIDDIFKVTDKTSRSSPDQLTYNSGDKHLDGVNY